METEVFRIAKDFTETNTDTKGFAIYSSSHYLTLSATSLY